MSMSSADGKFFVGGLNKNKTTTNGLKDFFSRFGNLIDCAVVTGPDRKSRGFGFVQYESGNEAISKGLLAEEIMLDGVKVDVKSAVPRDEIDTNSRARKLLVSNVAPTENENSLSQVFARYGGILSVSFQRQGEAVIEFEKEDNAENAFRAVKDINGARVTVRKLEAKAPASSTRRESNDIITHDKLYIGNVPDALSNEDLRAFFQPYGELLFCEARTDFNGKRKGFAHVHFRNVENCKKCLQTIGSAVEIKGHKVTVDQATKKRSGGDSRRSPARGERRDRDDYRGRDSRDSRDYGRGGDRDRYDSRGYGPPQPYGYPQGQNAYGRQEPYPYYPPQPGYPASYPPHGAYPPSGPPPSGSYPPPAQGAYPPAAAPSYPPQGGQSGYPPQGPYAPSSAPPTQAQYAPPPQSQGYPSYPQGQPEPRSSYGSQSQRYESYPPHAAEQWGGAGHPDSYASSYPY